MSASLEARTEDRILFERAKLLEVLDDDPYPGTADAFERVQLAERLWAVRESKPRKLTTAGFDVDGTLLNDKEGWQNIMGPIFIGLLQAYSNPTVGYEEAKESFLKVVEDSVGKPTYTQMVGFIRLCEQFGYKGPVLDHIAFKKVYNDPLMATANWRRANWTIDQLRIPGADALLDSLSRRNLAHGLYAMSGSDHQTTIDSLQCVRFADYFAGEGHIVGAGGQKLEIWDCAKDAVFDTLLQQLGVDGESIMVVGDGPIEICKGKKIGAVTFGVLSDEKCIYGGRFTPESKARLLTRAGADFLAQPPFNVDAMLHYAEQGYRRS